MNKELLELLLRQLSAKTNEPIDNLYEELVVLTQQTLKDIDYDNNY